MLLSASYILLVGMLTQGDLPRGDEAPNEDAPTTPVHVPGGAWEAGLDSGLNALRQERFEEAEIFLRGVVEQSNVAPGREAAAVEPTVWLAATLAYQGKNEEAASLLKHALRILEREPRRGSLEVVLVLNTLAGVHLALGDSEAARQVLDRARTLSEADPAGCRELAPLILNNRAQVAILGGRNDEAERLLRQALEVAGGPEARVHILRELAGVLCRQGRPDQAEPLAREVVQIERTSPGVKPLDSARTYGVLAEVLLAQGRPAEAETYAGKSVAMVTRILGEDDIATAERLRGFAAMFVRAGRFQEAEPLAAKALATAEAATAGPQEDVDLWPYLVVTAEVAQGQGRNEQAEVQLRRVLALSRADRAKVPQAVVADLLQRLSALQSTRSQPDPIRDLPDQPH